MYNKCTINEIARSHFLEEKFLTKEVEKWDRTGPAWEQKYDSDSNVILS